MIKPYLYITIILKILKNSRENKKLRDVKNGSK